MNDEINNKYWNINQAESRGLSPWKLGNENCFFNFELQLDNETFLLYLLI